MTSRIRLQHTRRRLERELSRAAAEPQRFARAVDAELGPVPRGAVEPLRARVLSGEPWLPRLVLGSDATLYSRDADYFADSHTVVVNEDLKHDDARIERLYRSAVRAHVVPRPAGPGARLMSWLRAA